MAAASLGLPVVDADTMGRAFPELQMCSVFWHGTPVGMAALADASGNVELSEGVVTPHDLEAVFRAHVVRMGCLAGISMMPLSGAQLRKAAVLGTLTTARRIGEAAARARATKTDVVAAVAAHCGGQVLFTGKIAAVERSVAAGFTRGHLILHRADDGGAGAVGGVRLDLQNEFVAAWQLAPGDTGSDATSADAGAVEIQPLVGGAAAASTAAAAADAADAHRHPPRKLLAIVPDLLTLLDAETGRPIQTEEVRYGVHVSLLALRAHDMISSELALKWVGPAAFGYKLDAPPPRI